MFKLIVVVALALCVPKFDARAVASRRIGDVAVLPTPSYKMTNRSQTLTKDLSSVLDVQFSYSSEEEIAGALVEESHLVEPQPTTQDKEPIEVVDVFNGLIHLDDAHFSKLAEEFDVTDSKQATISEAQKATQELVTIVADLNEEGQAEGEAKVAVQRSLQLSSAMMKLVSTSAKFAVHGLRILGYVGAAKIALFAIPGSVIRHVLVNHAPAHVTGLLMNEFISSYSSSALPKYMIALTGPAGEKFFMYLVEKCLNDGQLQLLFRSVVNQNLAMLSFLFCPAMKTAKAIFPGKSFNVIVDPFCSAK